MLILLHPDLIARVIEFLAHENSNICGVGFRRVVVLGPTYSSLTEVYFLGFSCSIKREGPETHRVAPGQHGQFGKNRNRRHIKICDVGAQINDPPKPNFP